MALKTGQKVWYINHSWHTLEEGTLVSTEDQSGHDELPTLSVKDKRYGMTHRILTNWVFTTEEKGQAKLEKKIRQDIQHKRNEIKRLERKL